MRFRISRLMAITAVLGVNIGWIRAYLLAEVSGGSLLELFNFVFLNFFALQFALWRYRRTTRRHRQFWLGFVVSSPASTVALMMLLASNIDRLNWYNGVASDLSYYCLPARIDVVLSTVHWDWFLAIIYFLPELLAASLGGLLAACLFRRVEVRSVPAVQAIPRNGFRTTDSSGA